MLMKFINFQRNLYECWLSFIKKIGGDSCVISELEAKLSACQEDDECEDEEEAENVEENDVVTNQPYMDEWDEQSDVQILARCTGH